MHETFLSRCSALVMFIFSAAAVIAAPPRAVSIVPAPGSTDVDPQTTAIVAQFDQDMGGGMSWTGGGPMFPAVDESAKAGWINPRTCVLPVKLQPGKAYRLGLNAPSYQNFRSAAGEPLAPQIITFATKGAPPEELAKLSTPRPVKFNPPNGAKGVSPATAQMSVTFDQPMGGGMSWVGGGENYPEITSPGTWSADHLTCTIPVKLKPNHSYKIGINSPNFKNFASQNGIPAEPAAYEFSTGAQ